MTSIELNNVENDKLNCNAKDFVPMQKQDYEGDTYDEYDMHDPYDEEFETSYEKTKLDPTSDKLQYYNPDEGEVPLPGKYCPPLNREFSAISVKDIPRDKMSQIIGGEGKVFKAITLITNVDYIYYLESEGIITVWGYEHLLPDAVNRLYRRIQLVMNNFLHVGAIIDYLIINYSLIAVYSLLTGAS